MPLRTPVCAALALALTLLAVPLALAHVTVTPRAVPAGSYTKLTFTVPHGCDGSPTTRIRVAIPQGVVSVKPQVVPGWTIETVSGTYETPVMLNGAPVAEGVTEVSWSGGPLDDRYMQEFGMSVHVPDLPAERLSFPVIQECAEGETRWIQEPVDGQEPEEPAPAVLLAEAPLEVPAEAPAEALEATSTPHTHADEEHSASGDEHSDESHVDDYGFSFLTGAALVMGATGMILSIAALMALRARS